MRTPATAPKAYDTPTSTPPVSEAVAQPTATLAQTITAPESYASDADAFFGRQVTMSGDASKLYVASFYYDLALFRYYPEVSEFHLLRNDRLGVVILWYGWIATSALATRAEPTTRRRELAAARR